MLPFFGRGFVGLSALLKILVMKETMLQICPVGAPCYARYVIKQTGKEDKYMTVHVQAWVLVEDDRGNRKVKGMTSIDVGKGFCEDSPGFLGYSDVEHIV